MFGIGPTELIVFALIALLLFGNRLPSVMRSLGQGISEFKKGVHGIEDEVKNADKNKIEHK
jgi:sec-independent protein translocase protein TatA